MRSLFFLVFLAAAFLAIGAIGLVQADPPAKQATEGDATEAAAQDKPNSDATSEEAPQYLRLAKTEAGKPSALQTAIVRYVGKPDSQYAGQEVDLVGVVHIGERDYYEELNDRLATYDTVLYELVAPDGTRIKPEDLEKRRSILASMQSGMKDMLNLEYQLERVDYMVKNFRHADMSPTEFAEDLERRGDSLFKMFARMMGAGLASSAATGGDAGLMIALLSGEDRPKMMKQAMARQLVDVELVTAGIDDENGENTLIKGRNAKAFQILKAELDEGSDKVAVFYGAGHLPDMAERLEKDFGMKAVGSEWFDAWDLTRN